MHTIVGTGVCVCLVNWRFEPNATFLGEEKLNHILSNYMSRKKISIRMKQLKTLIYEPKYRDKETQNSMSQGITIIYAPPLTIRQKKNILIIYYALYVSGTCSTEV